MNKILSTLLLSLGFAVCANAQTNGVTTSTDPAKAAAVERHAADLKAMQSRVADTKTMPMHSGKHHAMHHAKHHAKMHHGASKAKTTK